MATKKDFQEYIKQAHRYAGAGLMQCSSGNLSWRIGENALISGSGSWLSNIKENEISICNIAKGIPQNRVKPSIEAPFHLGILRNRADINIVLHFQSEYATAVSCMKEKPRNFNVTIEIPCYLGRDIPIVPYYTPGSPELTNVVVDAMQKHNSILLTNHGQVVCGKDFDQVYQRAIFLEMACRIIIQTRGEYSVLTDRDIDNLDYYILGKKK